MDCLRARATPVVSLVAVDGEEVVGHIMFSPVSVTSGTGSNLMGLGPMAVAPNRQRRGIGGLLIRAGLERCKRMGCSAVVVLGHPNYYPRFGFCRASQFGLYCEHDVPEEAFMAIELQPGILDGTAGRVQYHAAFTNV